MPSKMLASASLRPSTRPRPPRPRRADPPRRPERRTPRRRSRTAGCAGPSALRARCRRQRAPSASRTSMTVAAGRSTHRPSAAARSGCGRPRCGRRSGRIEATLRGYRHEGGAPPERPNPWSTLMPPMSLDAPEPAESPVVHTIPRRYVALGLIVLAIILVGALIVIRNANQTDDTSDVETITPAPTSVITALAHSPPPPATPWGDVTEPTRSRRRPPRATPPSGSPRPTAAGARPVVFFYGAEFAPYAAAERWPLIVALSRFGTFSQLGLMQSSSSVAFSDTPTFTFWHAKYSSVWIDLQTDRALQLARPDRRRLHDVADPHGPAGRLGRGLRHVGQDVPPARHREPLRAGRDRASRRPCSTACRNHRSPTTWRTPANPVTQAIVARPTRSRRPSAP